MDAKLYHRILSVNLIPTAKNFYRDGEQWYFLQDNDPKHKSKLVTEWLHNSGVTCIDFPPYSPDLNPIENLWSDMNTRVQRHNPTTMEELQDVIAEEWELTSLELLISLSHSMPSRCQQVVDALGYKTKY